MTLREREDSAAGEAPAPARPAPHTSDHSANERTFLAWVRTSIAVIGLGFVVAKFSVWLRQLAARLDDPARPGATAPPANTSLSLPLCVTMMALGVVLAVVAARRFQQVRRAIDRGEPSAGERTMVAVTLMVVAISAALVAYMLATA